VFSTHGAIVQRPSRIFACILGSILFASNSWSLEKRAVPALDRADAWNSGATCHLSYYNICTGWIWVWSSILHRERFGVVFAPGASHQLLQSSIYVVESSPPGYNYTGTIAVHHVDANDCPSGPAIASQPFLPTSVFHLTDWGGLPVPAEFALVVTKLESEGPPNPARFATDHPAAGPTGPQACGACYPATRVNRSFLWGDTVDPVCPGSTFDDGVCDAQLYWDVSLTCLVSTETSSWGKIKELYK
jgi:hypothetical protein